MNEVMRRHMFAQGGFVRPMQEGGMASMQLMPEQAAPPMMPDPAAQMMPEGMGMEQAAQGAAAQGVDPAQLETMLGDYDQQMTRLGEAEDYESVINSIRGDEMPMAARYDELAGIVGQEDATATPESVLTLMQPVMQIAAVDQGIGGLAQDEMMAPVEGPMAEGIMSTVNMGAAEGPAPVNFRYGGAVQHMNNGGPVRYMAAGAAVPDNSAPRTLSDRYNEELGVMQGIIGGTEEKAQALADQKNMTQAQMLFDVAQGALAFASPGDRQMSPAERLAQSFSPVLGSIGARAGELQKFEQDQGKEGQALKLQALGSAQNSMLEQQKQAGDTSRAREQQQATSIQNALQISSTEGMQQNKFSFTKGENETDRDHQSRLALEAIDARTNLQLLVGKQGDSAAAARSIYEQQLAVLNGEITASSQSKLFDFTSSERVSTQDFKKDMQSALFVNGQTMLALENNYSTAAMEQKNKLIQENMKLAEQIDVSSATVDFGRKLQALGVQNAYDLGKIQVNFENTTAGAEQANALSRDLAGYNAVLQQKSQNIQNVFNAGESALARAGQFDRQVSEQEFRTMLQDDMQMFELTEAQKVAAVAKLNRLFDEKLATRSAEQKDKSLTLKEREQILDETYKLGNLAIDQAASKAVSLGSKTTTATINYLSDPTRLAQYEAGTLSQAENTVFEQLVLDYTSPKPVWNGDTYVPGAVSELAPDIRQAMEKRQDSGNGNIIIKDYVRLAPTTAALSSEEATDLALPPEIVSLNDATTDLFNPNGRVNRDSEAWSLTPPTRFNSKLDYRKVVGASGFFPSLAKMFSEGSAEMFGGSASKKATDFAEAASSLDAFANDLLLFSTNQADGRVLKFVQEKLAKEVDNIRPGGLFLKTDADAEASFKTLLNTVETQMQRARQILPEYGGKKGNYTKAQVTGVREDMNKIKSYMNELLAFEKGFAFKPTPKAQATDENQSIGNVKNQIQSMRNLNSQ